MPLLISSFIRAALWFASGIGVTSLVDKFFPDTLPSAVKPLSNVTDPVTKKINWMRVAFIIILGGISIMVIRFVGRKLKVNILK